MFSRGLRGLRGLNPVNPWNPWLLLWIEFQSGGVYAISQAGGARAVREDVAQVGAAGITHHFGPAHSVAVVVFGFHVFFGDGFVEAGPSAAGIEFRARIEQFVSARGAAIHSRLFRIVIFSREGRFGALHPADLVLFRCEFFLPVLFGFLNFLHTVIVRHASLFSVGPTGRSPHALRPEIPAFRPIIQADSISSR